MGLFTKIPKGKLQVIAVQSEVRNTETYDIESMDYRGNYTHKPTKAKGSKSSHNVTIVLVVKGGEMYTKEFNGKWDLKDVKEWEKTNG